MLKLPHGSGFGPWAGSPVRLSDPNLDLLGLYYSKKRQLCLCWLPKGRECVSFAFVFPLLVKCWMLSGGAEQMFHKLRRPVFVQELVKKSRKWWKEFWHDQSTKDTDHSFWKQEYLLQLGDSPLWNHTGLHKSKTKQFDRQRAAGAKTSQQGEPLPLLCRLLAPSKVPSTPFCFSS